MRALDFIGIGSPKCGTTWIAQCLAEHPEVFMPRKEFKYFDRLYKPDLKGFAEHFEDAPQNKITGEFTPRYFIDRAALERIKHHFPGVKTIMVLRDPIERAVSQFRFHIYNVMRENIYSFREVLESPNRYHYTEKGLYARYIRQVYEIFPKEQVCIILYDEIKSEPGTVLRNLYSYLGIDAGFTPESLHKKVHVTKAASELPPHGLLTLNKLRQSPEFKKPLQRTALRIGSRLYRMGMPVMSKLGWTKNDHIVTVEQEALDYLYNDYFRDDIAELEALTGLDLAHWKRTVK
ncbi:MAG: hypothetical protein EOP49_04895 [Sphingobacteriales bacterium]|nr:MAG: hypothetical protein EOP49_04895 [Sphingobacteriales bacterium]